MDNPAEPDKTLLDRLYALKPTAINLDPSSKSAPASTIEPVKPVWREDGLSERLKSLRNQLESIPDSHRSVTDLMTSTSEAQPQARGLPAERGPQSFAQNTSSTVPGNDDVDPLLNTDDQTLEELLADLGSDEQWLEEVAVEFAAEVAADEEHRRVIALLEELGKAPSSKAVSGENMPGLHESKVENENTDDDESDGEQMACGIDHVLEQAADEAEWEKANELPGKPKSARTSPPVRDTKLHSSSPQSGITTNSSVASRSFDQDTLNLPTVPAELQGQPNLPDSTQEDADFEADIVSRLAALKGLGSARPLPSAPTSQVDHLGLPVAPTFAPEDRPVTGVYKRLGYTDEDQKSWCIVCLEDGAIRCLGCDDDVYCARCWKSMHVGPAASYDERGHKWEKFDKDK